MSYDVEFIDEETEEVVQADKPHYIHGGTYAVGGTLALHLNITYNYGEHFRAVLGPKGIRSLYGMPAAEVITALDLAAEVLDDGEGEDPDYWKPTAGNARKALLDLAALARMAPPNAVLRGD